MRNKQLLHGGLGMVNSNQSYEFVLIDRQDCWARSPRRSLLNLYSCENHSARIKAIPALRPRHPLTAPLDELRLEITGAGLVHLQTVISLTSLHQTSCILNFGPIMFPFLVAARLSWRMEK